MIRVVLRHENDADGVMLGDFTPSEVRPLIELLSEASVFAENGDLVEVEGTTQFVLGGGRGAPRYVFEIILR